MKNYYKIVAAVAAVFLVGIILLIVFTGGGMNGVENNGTVSMLNDIAKTAEEHHTDLSVLDDTPYNVDFVIVDLTENVLYTNSRKDISGEKLSPETAMQKHYLYKYLTDNGRVWGCIILLDDGMSGFMKIRNRIIAGAVICSLLIIIGMIAFGMYINKNIIIPFDNMKNFAGKVAEGNLDEPLMMDKNNMFGAFSESFDIMREELSEAKRRELELQKKERELVASLSHDLKTPVTGIKLTAELMQMRLSVKNDNGDAGSPVTAEDISKLSEDAEGIRQKAEQIDVLVSDLFTSTLDDLGEFKVNCQDEDSRLLGDIVKSFDDRSLTVSEEIPEVVINIDKKRMSQVIGNVISNSYKYANTQIDISYRISEDYLEMQIKDHGPGVPSGELDLITNKFYRGKNWENTDKDGNGLGLYIAKTLMKKMNGDLIAESDGDGLAITLIIPLS